MKHKHKTRAQVFLKKNPHAWTMPVDSETPRCCCLLAGYTDRCLMKISHDLPACCIECWGKPMNED